MDIKKIIGETSSYDKKQSLEEKKPKSWCKSVSAFANSDGGALIFGVDDNNNVVGLANAEKDAEKISEIIKTHIDSIPNFSLQFEEIDGKKIIVLYILKGTDTPYFYSFDGVMEAYIRVGNESIKASSTELKRLVLKGKNSTYDTQLSGYFAKDYAFTKLKERFKSWNGQSFEDKFLLSFGLVNENGELTYAGALLADNSPIKYSRVFCTRWNGLNKSGGTMDALDSEEYSGSLITLIEDSECFISRNYKTMWRKIANSREEYPEYVERSYHEALINALVHRDYLIIGSEVHIDMFDDRMEIYSPGGMVDGINIQDRNPLSVPSTRRNPLLADVFERLGYMEHKGSGLSKILYAYEFQKKYSKEKKPSFLSDRAQFTVIMPNLNYDAAQETAQETEDFAQENLETAQENRDFAQETVKTAQEKQIAAQETILTLIEINPTITRKEIAEKMDLSSDKVIRILDRMKKEGIIHHEGATKTGSWVIDK